MTAFNAQVNMIDLQVLVPEELPDGVDPSFEVALVLGTVVPMQSAQGLQGVIVPFGTIRFNVTDRETAEGYAAAMAEAAATLPSKAASTLLTASNMADVERAAQQMQAATSGQVR